MQRGIQDAPYPQSREQLHRGWELTRWETGVQGRERLGWWWIQSQGGVRGGMGWMRSWCCICLVLTGTAFPELPKLLLVQALSSCSWKYTAPVGHSPEPCSSPVLFPSDGMLRLGTAFWPGPSGLWSFIQDSGAAWCQMSWGRDKRSVLISKALVRGDNSARRQDGVSFAVLCVQLA